MSEMTALPEAYFRAEVLEVTSLSSVMRRIVLGGEGSADYRSSGAPDEWLRLMVPPQRQQQVELPVKQGQQFHFAEPATVAPVVQRAPLGRRAPAAHRGCRRARARGGDAVGRERASPATSC